jgi:hypothetical protein
MQAAVSVSLVGARDLVASTLARLDRMDTKPQYRSMSGRGKRSLVNAGSIGLSWSIAGCELFFAQPLQQQERRVASGAAQYVKTLRPLVSM